ncbi:MAG: hypothetical protein U0353_12255 [Sandaracinus sp.]
MRLLVRADASHAMGAGHVLRCLAIAQAWADAGLGELTLASRELPPSLRARYEAEGARVVDLGSPDGCTARSFEELVRSNAPHVVVMDGYHLGPEDRRAARSSGAPLALIDDNREVDVSEAALVINPGPRAHALDYGATPALRGLEHALLRRELRRAAEGPPRDLALDRAPVLVTLGGSDPRGLTEPIVARLRARGVPVVALVGALASAGAPDRGLPIEGATWMRSVDDVVPIFDRVGWALSAAGGTALELAALGHPVVSLATVSNQRALAHAWAERVAPHDVGVGPSFDLVGLEGEALARALDEAVLALVRLRGDAAASARHARAARARLDGQGAARIARALALLGKSQRAT